MYSVQTVGNQGTSRWWVLSDPLMWHPGFGHFRIPPTRINTYLETAWETLKVSGY